jgi:hypothetical protein
VHLLWIISIEQRVVLRAGVKLDFSMKLKHYNMNTLVLFEVDRKFVVILQPFLSSNLQKLWSKLGGMFIVSATQISVRNLLLEIRFTKPEFVG